MTTTNTSRAALVDASILENGYAVESLVGSFFHAYSDGTDPEYDLPDAQGRVIGEPQAGTYLVQMFDSLGTPTHQELAGLDRMSVQHWAFYDTQESMQQRYLALQMRTPA
jgi:hypothetical protein